MNKRANISLSFDSKDHFIWCVIAGISSVEDAERFAKSSPYLSFEGGTVWVRSSTGIGKEVCSVPDGDEFGAWPPGSSREGMDALLEASVSFIEFLKTAPPPENFHLTWHDVQEWECDSAGEFIRWLWPSERIDIAVPSLANPA